MTATRSPSVVLTIFAKELRELLRDRRAVFFAFVLPLLLYPALFFALSSLPRFHTGDLRQRELSVGASGDVARFRERLTDGDALNVIPGAFSEERLRAGEIHAFVEVEARDAMFDTEGRRDAESDRADPGALFRVTVHYLASSQLSAEARRRVSNVLERWRRDLLDSRFALRGVELRYDDLVRVDPADVSTESERSGARLGRMLPFVLILLLFTGGAFAAIDLVAGEKERGTLETLCVQAISRGQVVTGKFLVILVASIASVFLNLAGLLLAFALGLGVVWEDGVSLVLPSGGLFVVALLLIPLAVLTSAVLLGLSAFARSYREAQTYLLPLTLLSLIPAGLAAAPEVSSAGFLAVVPLANTAIALREALTGNIAFLPLSAVLVSTAAYSLVALRWAAGVLEREEVLLGLEAQPLASDATNETRERRGLAFGALMLLAVYFAAGWLQSGKHFSFEAGLALTLWGLIAGSAVLYPALCGVSVTASLALRRPGALDLPVAALMGAAAACLAVGWFEVQESFLPLPEGFARELERLFELRETSGLVAFLLFAASPGITEELLWRGAFQSDVGARGRPVRTVLMVGVFFGLFHLSIYRFIPTALAGMALAAVRLRTRSVFPCMVFHTAFNGVALFVLPGLLERGEASGSVLGRPVLLLAAAAVLVFGFRAIRRRKTGRSE